MQLAQAQAGGERQHDELDGVPLHLVVAVASIRKYVNRWRSNLVHRLSEVRIRKYLALKDCQRLCSSCSLASRTGAGEFLFTHPMWHRRPLERCWGFFERHHMLNHDPSWVDSIMYLPKGAVVQVLDPDTQEEASVGWVWACRLHPGPIKFGWIHPDIIRCG